MKDWMYRNLPTPVLALLGVLWGPLGVVVGIASLMIWPKVIGPIVFGLICLAVLGVVLMLIVDSFDHSLHKAKRNKQRAVTQHNIKRQAAIRNEEQSHAEQLRILSDRIAALNKKDEFQKFIEK